MFKYIIYKGIAAHPCARAEQHHWRCRSVQPEPGGRLRRVLCLNPIPLINPKP